RIPQLGLEGNRRSGSLRHVPQVDADFAEQLEGVFVILTPFRIVHVGLVGDNHGNTALDNGTGAVHAGKACDVKRAITQWNTYSGGVVDGVALWVFSPQVFRRDRMPLRDIIVHATGQAVVACGANLAMWTDNDAADLAVVVLTPFTDLFGETHETTVPFQLCGRGNLYGNVTTSLKCAHC